MILPEVINNFNVYDGNNNKYIGVSGEVSLADIDQTTAAISGAGLLGELNIPVIGQLAAIEQVIPFNVLTVNLFSQFKLHKVATVVLRGDIQSTDTSTGEFKHEALRITLKGYVKKVSPGKVKAADSMGSSVTLELTYISIRINDQIMIKIDKLNSVYIVNGEDILADIKKNC